MRNITPDMNKINKATMAELNKERDSIYGRLKYSHTSSESNVYYEYLSVIEKEISNRKQI